MYAISPITIGMYSVTETDTTIVTSRPLQRSLSGIRLLEPLDDDTTESLERQCKWRRYRSGERLFARGSVGREVFFIVNGEVQILGTNEAGKEITLAHIHAGDTVGEMAAIDGQPRSANVVAVEDTLVAVLEAESFVELLKRNGEISFELLHRLSSMVRKGDERVLELSILEAKQRICAELLRLARRDAAASDLWVISPLPSLRQIAGSASTSREVAASTLSQLYPRGIATRRGENLYILDRPALEGFARTSL